jgi:hypothetical protein
MSAFAVRYKTVDLGDVQMFYREAGAIETQRRRGQ